MSCSPTILAKEARRRAKRNADPERLAKHQAYMRQYASDNRERLNDLNRSLYARKKHIIRLQRKGIEPTEERLNYLANHSGKCDICGNIGDGRWKELSIDHCHDTGIMRGMLCSSCNRALGLFKDDTELLQKAQNYLIQYRKMLPGEFTPG